LRFLALHLIFVFWGKPYIFRSSANEVGWWKVQPWFWEFKNQIIFIVDSQLNSLGSFINFCDREFNVAIGCLLGISAGKCQSVGLMGYNISRTRRLTFTIEIVSQLIIRWCWYSRDW
jgi:hypothetical protein